MADDKIVNQTPDQLDHDLAWGLHDNAWLLPEAPRKGRIRPTFGECLAIAKRMIDRLKAHGVVEVRRRMGRDHSYPPREPRE